MRAAVVGMVLLCLVSGCTKPPHHVTNSIGMELIEIPAGKFTMGEGSRAAGVTLTKSFWLGKTEVTQGHWQQVMGTQPWVGRDYVKPDKNGAAVYVTWDDATGFCQELTDRDHKNGKLPAGEEYRLPTEAQWEYACRAGTTTAYSFGDDENQLGQYAWFDGNTDNAFNAFEQYAHAGGLEKPNPWGLFDMHGNVFEWCSDSERRFRDRVTRGGGWRSYPDSCTSAVSIMSDASERCDFWGFRVARSQSAQ